RPDSDAQELGLQVRDPLVRLGDLPLSGLLALAEVLVLGVELPDLAEGALRVEVVLARVVVALVAFGLGVSGLLLGGLGLRATFLAGFDDEAESGVVVRAQSALHGALLGLSGVYCQPRHRGAEFVSAADERGELRQALSL